MTSATNARAQDELQSRYGFHTGVDAKAEALARAEAATSAVANVGVRLKSNKLLKRALNAWHRGDAAKTAKFALKATELDEDHAQAYHVLAIALDKLGYVHKALVTYERAFALDPDDSDLLLNLGLTAWHLGHLKGAERLFRLFIEKRPDHPAGYNNLGSVMRDQGDLATGIETLRSAIYRMPEESMLWNTLATALAEDGRVEESLVFYQEALRLSPNLARVWHNFGYSYMHLGQYAAALEVYDKALGMATHARDRNEIMHSRSICLLGIGQIAEGFADYEIRNAPDFRDTVVHYTKAPCWNGEPLADGRILLVGEQGLGDELMFANIIPDIVQALGPNGALQIAVDRRLVPLFARSFPNAEVGCYEDRKAEANRIRIFPWAQQAGDPDYYAPFGTPLQFLRKSIDDFPRQAFLKPDPGRSKEFRARLAALGPAPYVGICWRSMVLGVLRKKYYSVLEAWKEVLTVPDVTFVNLQYGDCTEELNAVCESLGIRIHQIADLDLRADIEGAAALSDACDLVISAPTAAAALAGAIGKEVWFLLAGRGWPQLGTDYYPWYAASRVFSPEKLADWDSIMPQLAEALRVFSQAKRPALSA